MLLGYFSYYAVEGERGLLAYLSLTQEIRKATITRDLIHADWAQLDKRVALLRPNSIDPDMLEERALAHARPRQPRRRGGHAAAPTRGIEAFPASLSAPLRGCGSNPG